MGSDVSGPRKKDIDFNFVNVQGVNNDQSLEAEKEAFRMSYENGKYFISTKCTFLGESAVGKSSIILRFVRNHFYEYQESTIGAAFLTENSSLEYFGKNFLLKLEIWDTAGQERYTSLAPMYYRSAGIVVIVYDILSKSSLNRARRWINEVLRQGDQKVVLFLVGNKVDLEDIRNQNLKDPTSPSISTEMGQKCADEFDRVTFLGEVSAKSGKGIKEMFQLISTNFIEKYLLRIGITNEVQLKTGSKEDDEEEENEGEEVELEDESPTKKGTVHPPLPISPSNRHPSKNIVKKPNEGMIKMEQMMKGAISRSKNFHEMYIRSTQKHHYSKCKIRIVPKFIEIEEKLTVAEFVFFKKTVTNKIRIERSLMKSIVLSDRLKRISISYRVVEESKDEIARLDRQIILQCEDEESFEKVLHEFRIVYKEIVVTENEDKNPFITNITETYLVQCSQRNIKPISGIRQLLTNTNNSLRFEIRNDLVDIKRIRSHIYPIFSALGWSSTIRFLNLSNLKLKMKDMNYLWSKCLVINSRQITHVRIDGNPSVCKIIPLISEYYIQRKLFIRYLSLRSVQLGDKNARTLLCSLLEEKYLQHLDLSNNQLTDDINVELGHLCAHQNSLTEIDLENNNIMNSTSFPSKRSIQFKLKGNPCYGFEKEDVFDLDSYISNSINSEDFILDESEFEMKDQVIYTSPGGGHTKILRATWNGAEVVVKKILILNEWQRNIIRKEAYLAFGFHHPSVITTYGFIPKKKSVSIVFESMKTDLFHLLHYNNNNVSIISWKQKKRIIQHIISGMIYLHSKNVHHLDLKPSNILCSEDGSVIKITDFGFSERKQLTVSSFSSVDIRGTCLYVAPESVLRNSYSFASDVYSFGIMLYEIVFQRFPFYDRKEEDFEIPKLASLKIAREKIRPKIDTEMIDEILIKEKEKEGGNNRCSDNVRMEVEVFVGLMKKCWEEEKSERPTFKEILRIAFSPKENE